MFNLSLNETDYKNFYPTPTHLVSKMKSKVKDWDAIQSVLEPSAGKGDIAKIIQEIRRYGRNDKALDVDCIEIDPNLQHILRGNDLRVVHDDFLTYKAFKRYQLIIMNPPFDCADKHLLKAIDMQQRGGQIVCLLNAETLLNPCTNFRKELVRKLNELEADVEFIKDGFCYDAERKTNVKVALVHIYIKDDKVVSDESFIYNTLRKAREEQEFYKEVNDMTSKLDFIEQIVEEFNFEVEGTLRLIREYEAFRPYMKRAFLKEGERDYYGGMSILTLTLSSNDRVGSNQTVDINKYLEVVRYKYWNALFSNEEFTKNLTSNLVQEYRERVAKMSNYDFSVFNIKQIQIEMTKGIIKGVEDTILKLFDEFSHKHYYYDEMSGNTHLFNGWKTNKAWYINKKVIIPLAAYRDLEYSWGGYLPTKREVTDKLTDIEKVFDYLDGGRSSHVDLHSKLKQAETDGTTKKIQLKYFTVTFYKKGTCHIEFTNLELLKKFNIYGAKGKEWLPPSYGTKSYNSMSAEEKDVIDNFEGQKEYEKVLSQRSYYMVESSDLLMLPEAI